MAWAGSNAAAKNANVSLRLYLSLWENPQPDKKVLSIDFVSTKTIAGPFCVAITVEEPVADGAPPAPAAKPKQAVPEVKPLQTPPVKPT